MDRVTCELYDNQLSCRTLTSISPSRSLHLSSVLSLVNRVVVHLQPTMILMIELGLKMCPLLKRSHPHECGRLSPYPADMSKTIKHADEQVTLA